MSQSAMPEQPVTQITAATEGDYRGGERPPESPQRRQLRRSKENRVVAGVCGGLGRYFDTDPVLFRIAFVALLIPGGVGLLLYIISLIVIPEFRSVEDERRDAESRPMDRSTAATVVGALMILIGGLILLERFIDWFDPRIIGGGALILIGAFIVWRGLRRGD
jgi:phage shock protein PspC (stress-responsive transcriptional regulator)